MVWKVVIFTILAKCAEVRNEEIININYLIKARNRLAIN